MHISHIFVNNLNTSPQERSAIFPVCLGKTLLFRFNEFYSFTMLPLNSITLRYHNAERVN